MRIVVVGAGAIGTLVAARLVRAGNDVGVVARGDALSAIRSRGLQVRDRDGSWTATPARAGCAADVGTCDVAIVCLKAHAIAGALSELVALRDAGTLTVFAANGLPWWYFHRHPGGTGNPHLASVDPGGAIWRAIGPERAAGAIVYAGASVVTPGEIHHAWGARLVLGAPDPCAAERLARVVETLGAAGFRATVSPDIRAEVWRKLAYNLAIGPVSLITGATCDRIASDRTLVALMEAMIGEAIDVARATGAEPGVDPAEQVRGFGAIGAFRTSMLQDIDAGRSPELEPVLGAVDELARRTAVPAHRIAEVLALARLRVGEVRA